jgi:transposase InsO family protein
MSFDEEIDDRRRDIALFRESILEELATEELARGELSVRIAELATRSFETPWGKLCRFTTRTLWSWWSLYKQGGLVGLVPKRRSDKGVSREVTPQILEAAIQARREVPSRSTKTLIDLLVRQQLVPRGSLARSTLDRQLEQAGFSRRRLKTLGAKRYIRLLFERPNQFWIGDYHEAPILYEPRTDSFKTIHLGAFIDHYSKLVPHGQWYTNERIATLEDTFKKAILKRGLADKVYVDNGSVYRSHAFAFALAQFGIRLCRSKPYASEGRGGIERFNRTVAEQFEPEVRAARIVDLHQINLFFEAWLEERYHRERHEATGQPPLDRFALDGFTPRFPDPARVQDSFRVRVRRRVHPKTATVEVDGRSFLVESFLRGRWVQVYYDPHRLDDILVFLNDKRVQRALPPPRNEKPQPVPERPTAAPLTFDYLASLRAAYDQRVAEAARRLSLADWRPSTNFDLKAFLDLCTRMLGKELSPYERDELTTGFNTVGPFSEPTARLALEHALKLRGRGLHVSVYTHYLKTFHLQALRALGPTDKRKDKP